MRRRVCATEPSVITGVYPSWPFSAWLAPASHHSSPGMADPHLPSLSTHLGKALSYSILALKSSEMVWVGFFSESRLLTTER